MNQIVGLIIVCIYALVYILYSVFQYRNLKNNLGERFKTIFRIFFILERMLVIIGLTLFTIFTFQEYIMFCYAKILCLLGMLLGIISIEFYILALSIKDNDYYDFNFENKSYPILLIVTIVIIWIFLFFFLETTKIDVDPKIEYEIQYLTNDLREYMKGDELFYSYCYKSYNGNKIIYTECSAWDAELHIINENNEPYVKVTTITDQCMFIEEKENKIHPKMVLNADNELEVSQTKSYKIFVPPSKYIKCQVDTE